MNEKSNLQNIHYKKRVLTVQEALDKISNGEFVYVDDVKALLGNSFGSLVFFERKELEKRLKENPGLFCDWMAKQLMLFKKVKT